MTDSPIVVEDRGRVRVLTLDRPASKNAMNAAMWDGFAEALDDAATAPGVAVVLLTGAGDAFCAGQDLHEMAQMAAGQAVEATHGFPGVSERVAAFPKPLVVAVNGLAVGFGATVLGHADLVFMSSAARIRCPFTSLGVAPELASSFTFPTLLGRQEATWVLMSSEWIDAPTCRDIGLAFRVCEPDALFDEAMRHAEVLAAKPISSLMQTKRTIIEGSQELLAAARARENDAFAALMGSPANIEALTAFAEKRDPDFASVDD